MGMTFAPDTSFNWSQPREVSTNCANAAITIVEFGKLGWKAFINDGVPFFSEPMPKAELIRHLESSFPFTVKVR